MPLILNGTTGVSGVDGSAGTPSYQGNDSNTGVFFPAADTIAFAEGGAEIARFDSSGNFGIGTTSPSQRLDVAGNTSGGYVVQILRNTNSGGYAQQIFQIGSANGTANIAYAPNIFFALGPSANDTTTPIVFQNNNATERMRITSAGLVGIGTNNPQATLDISRSAGGQNLQLIKPNAGTGGANIYMQSDSGSSGTPVQFNWGAEAYTSGVTGGGPANAYPLTFYTNASERMRIDSSGNVGIGTSSMGAKLQVLSGGTPITSGLGYGGMVVQNNGNALFDAASYVVGGSSGNSRFIGGFSTGASNLTVVAEFYADNASTRSCVRTNQSNGVFLASGGTSWGSLSDERAKTDLNPITNAVNKVTQLRAVTGRYKTDEESISRSFLIAQDVQKVLPEAISIDNEGNLGLQYTDTIPLLVAAIKEQQAMIEELKQEVAKLKGV